MNQERELQWEDTIEKDGPDFILLPEGDYDFTVAKFERARFAGSSKMPACNQAKLEIIVHSPQGDVSINHSLLLHTKTEGFLSNFFAGIGQKKKGEPLRMNWNAVNGAKGRLKLKINNFTKKDNTQGQSNEIVTFYSHEELAEKGIQVPAAGTGYQQQHQQSVAPVQQPPVQQYQQQAPQQYQQPQYQQQLHQAPFPTNPPQQGGGGFTPGQF